MNNEKELLLEMAEEFKKFLGKEPNDTSGFVRFLFAVGDEPTTREYLQKALGFYEGFFSAKSLDPKEKPHTPGPRQSSEGWVHDWAKWRAVDSDGGWFEYEAQPVLRPSGYWRASTTRYARIEKGFVIANSLTRRVGLGEELPKPVLRVKCIRGFEPYLTEGNEYIVTKVYNQGEFLFMECANSPAFSLLGVPDTTSETGSKFAWKQERFVVIGFE